MCGIGGYIGNQQAQPILLRALGRLEYRGYDSSGIAVKDGPIQTFKDVVRVATLGEMSPPFAGTSGIGYTRWATHGEPSRLNAHPHQDCRGKIAIVHNGVITNYQALKDLLTAEGHTFVSETDTEVIPHLIEKYYLGNIEAAALRAMQELRGSYAIAVLVEDEDKIVAAKNGSPVVIGLGDNETIIASDIPAVLDLSDRVIYLEDGDLAVISRGEVNAFNNGHAVQRQVCKVSWSVKDVQKGSNEHFMIKEIYEEPRVVRDTLNEYENSRLAARSQAKGGDKDVQDVIMLACGTSFHAGLIGKYVVEEISDIPVRVELASELNHRDRVTRASNAIAITQSGETADVLMAMKKLKERGCVLSVITNVQRSSASRLADKTHHILAGPEVSVAATKSFIGQLIVLYKLALSYPGVNAKIREKMELELSALPDKIQQVFGNEPQIVQCAGFLARHSNVFFVGRGANYPVALEGALKLKEISYIHAEGYAAGELKHGPFSLLKDDTPVVAVVALDKTYDSMLTNIKEIKARKAPVIAITSQEDPMTAGLVDFNIKVPPTMALLSPIVNAVVVQLLAYHAARLKSCPIDFPRNLAKSVTVE